jgi:dihydrofolate reductase
MLIYSMSVSVDGFISDREGAFGWTLPNEEQFRFHIAQTRELGRLLLGRRLYETMLVWETDPSMRDRRARGRVRRRLVRYPEGRLQPHARQRSGQCPARRRVEAEEAAAALDAADKDVAIGGAGLAAAAIELGLVDELRMFRNPVVVGGGTPFLPPVTEDVPLDLVETRTFGSRVIYERYRRVRDDSY